MNIPQQIELHEAGCMCSQVLPFATLQINYAHAMSQAAHTWGFMRDCRGGKMKRALYKPIKFYVT